MNVLAWQFAKNDTAYSLIQAEKGLSESPAPGMVRIRVHAASLNFRDIIAWKNLAGRPVDGRVPTSDGAGEVIGLGDGASGWKVGDRVAGCFFQNWESGPFDLSYHKQDLGGTLDGMLQQVVDLPATGIVAIPESLSYEHASTLPCAGLTAFYSLFSRAKLLPNQTILCIGTGGVSVFALQFAHAIGAKAIVLSRSYSKLEKAKALGAWKTISTTEHPQWSEQVWNATEGRGVDHVVEVGGPGTLEQSMNSVAASGTISLIGVLTGFGPPTASLFPLLSRNVTLNGIYVGPRNEFVAMNQFIQEKNVIPVIDSIFPFHQAPEAFQSLADANHFGKVVIRVS